MGSGTDLVVAGERPAGAMLTLKPLTNAADTLRSQNEIRKFVKDVLKDGHDYGIIKGTKTVTLLKPGSEKLLMAFGCVPVATVVESEIDHDKEVRYKKKNGDAGTVYGVYRYVVRVDVVDGNGVVRGSALGSCSTMESKYIDRPRDCENTVLKMATKRAQVAAVLNTFGMSDTFALEDEVVPEVDVEITKPEDRRWPSSLKDFAYAGKTFGETPTDVMAAKLASLTLSIEEARGVAGKEKMVEIGDKMVAVIEQVLENRRVEDENAAKTAKHVAAALEKNPPGAPALEDEGDDELPF